MGGVGWGRRRAVGRPEGGSPVRLPALAFFDLGVAIASGAAELGLVTGVVGGLVAGVLPGSGLQVSGPAAGLAVLVYEAVRAYGLGVLGVLGVLVFAAGVVQLGLGALRLGRWFRAVPVVVVQGMLAGIGIVLVAGQVYALGDVSAPGGALGTVAGWSRFPGTRIRGVGRRRCHPRRTPAVAALGVGGGWCPGRWWRWCWPRGRPGCSTWMCGGWRSGGCWLPYGCRRWRISGGSWRWGCLGRSSPSP